MNNVDQLQERLEKLEEEKEQLQERLKEASRRNRRQDYLRAIVEQVPELDESKHFMQTEQPSNKRFNKKGLKILTDFLEESEVREKVTA